MSQEVLNYLRNKYVQLGLLDKDGNHTIAHGEFNPYSYPDDHHIPQCPTCMQQFNDYKKMFPFPKKVEWNHLQSCIWHDYFVGKVKLLEPSIVVRYKQGN